ncbi:MAG: hypothetical protein K2K44_10395 [Oscillospiraceae bacterium]|nr:hypothetical protein [Oscillospiraceae bacterium]
MTIKIKRVIPILLFISVLFSACSKAEDTEISSVTLSEYSSTEESDTDDEIWSITGYYMRTDYSNFCVYEQSLGGNMEIFYEPLEIHFEGDEQGDVPIDSLKTGDKIEVDVKFILESYPPIAPIYGLRFIEEGDISNIDNDLLLNLESMGYHAVIGKKTEQPLITRHSGYFVRTETDCFLIPAEEYGMLSGIDLLKIHPASEVEAPPNFDVSGVSLDGFKTGDRIWVDVMLVQELYPPISPILGTALIETGDISNVDPEVISKLSELGYTAVEAE